MQETQLAVAITGAGGAGVISCGELLLQARASEGGYGLLRKAFGPQIRGGEAAALLQLTGAAQYTAAGYYDVLVALDWVNFGRFEDEIRISSATLVICQDEQPVPAAINAINPEIVRLPLATLARQAHPEGRENMLVTGLLGAMLGLSIDRLAGLATDKLSGKAAAYQDAAVACIRAGAPLGAGRERVPPPPASSDLWYLSGNQAAAYGALHAGVRFAAAYPITPASDVLEWLAGGLEQVGGQLVQAEDELAAINMTIGAAFGGVCAFTATSGPGLALMTESIGLAVASETPVTILNVMRGGPSTGIPTKSEQSDLNIALHGLHGDAPHLVLAPLDIADCVFTTGWAVALARQLQTAAIVLSDQFLGQSTAVVARPRHWEAAPPQSGDGTGPGTDNDYLRYRLTASGVSTMAAPGDADRRFTADGLEHSEKGTPSSRQSDHQCQLDKRLRKLDSHDFGCDWGVLQGEGAIALVCFGSASAAVSEAAALLRESGRTVSTISLRLLAPLPAAALGAALAGSDAVVVVEQNHGGQLFRYLRGGMDFTVPVYSCALPGPVPLDAGRIAAYVNEVTTP
jgi:2-oxoglutarate ferredoxin oxidoreductase subunit alpha